MTELDAEDAKLVVLARGAMGRAEAGSGAAVRDADGRTYAGAPVALDALQLTALQAAREVLDSGRPISRLGDAGDMNCPCSIRVSRPRFSQQARGPAAMPVADSSGMP